MKKFLKFNLKLILVFAIVFASVFGAKTFSKNKFNIVFATDVPGQEQEVDKMSIFIRKPTYSCFVDNRLYFIDEYDGYLKVYDTVTSYFEENYLDLSSYTILDATVLNNSFIMIVSAEENKNQIIQIQLVEDLGDGSTQTKFEIIKFDYKFDDSYKTLSGENVTFSSEEYLLVSLTDKTNNSSPLLVLFDSNKEATDIQIAFGTEQEAVSIQNNLIKMLTFQTDNEELYILFVYNIDGGARISYVSVDNYSDLLGYKTDKISTGITILTSDLLKNLAETTVFDVNFMTFDSESHIVVTYQDEESFWIGFTPNILVESGEFGIVGTHICYNAKYMMINNDVIAYCNGQNLYYSTISHKVGDHGETLINSSLVQISNPDCDITYFAENEFVYKTTTSQTKLLKQPWDSDDAIVIESGVDLIHIGTVKIKSLARTRDTVEISDYDYCLYTFDGKNYLGYIKNSDLVKKDEVSLKNSGYNYVEDSEGNVTVIVKVWPNTSIYSLPTNILGTTIVQGMVSEKIDDIADNSKVEIIDVLFNYECNGKKFVKVKVNDSVVGYIDASHIYSPKEVVEFVITNATIGHDNTKVFISADETSAVIYELNKGKQVRIDGKRDTHTGFTKITFNDEYGREITGYIVSDYVTSDSWSTLQIVGSILIAVNIGLLILILVYKNKHLSKDNAKKSEKF